MNSTTLNMTTLDGGVIIKKGTAPAPPSGGESGGSNMEYWDITAMSEGVYEVAQWATLLKYIRSERESIGSMYGLKLSNITPIAVAIDMSLKMANTNGEVKTVSEIFKDLGFPSFDTIGWKQITEAEFYTLD